MANLNEHDGWVWERYIYKKGGRLSSFFVLCAYSCKEMQIQLLKHSLKFGVNLLAQTFIAAKINIKTLVPFLNCIKHYL